MAKVEAEAVMRRYASGEIGLADLRKLGFGNYLRILGRLGQLGLRPPVAPLDGETAEMRRRGREIIAGRIRSA